MRISSALCWWWAWAWPKEAPWAEWIELKWWGPWGMFGPPLGPVLDEEDEMAKLEALNGVVASWLAVKLAAPGPDRRPLNEPTGLSRI